jgi:hypothetical protein
MTSPLDAHSLALSDIEYATKPEPIAVDDRLTGGQPTH